MKYVPFAIIQAAQHYDPEATGFVRRHFAGYIAYKALSPFLDEHGRLQMLPDVWMNTAASKCSRTTTYATRRKTPCLPLWAGFVSESPRRTSPFSVPFGRSASPQAAHFCGLETACRSSSRPLGILHGVTPRQRAGETSRAKYSARSAYRGYSRKYN